MKISVIYREVFIFLLAIAHCRNAPASHHQNKDYWYDKNKKLLENRMRGMVSLPRVKNVVVFIGDGLDIATITASRTLKRQLENNPNAHLMFDDFPATAFMQTDIINSQIPESAATATALFCGVKTSFDSIGVDTTAIGRDACRNIESHTPSIIAWAQEKNLKTGFVTTSRITHATPAALYAHSYRNTEDDSKAESIECGDIARQLIEKEPGNRLNVILGGGMRSFFGESDGGRRKDGRNLTNEWLEKHPNGRFVTTRKELMEVKKDPNEHLLGIFAKTHMAFNVDRNEEIEPSLAEMTQAAIEFLNYSNTRGFLLIVESAKIDIAHHHNAAFRALDETLQLDLAIDVAMRNIDLSRSLIIVTSDHASAMTYSGFATPKNLSVLGMDKYVSNIDSKKYQLLTYSSGQGHQYYNETIAQRDPKNAYHKATVPTTWANHAADDVPLYAIGSLANLLYSGTFDQTYLAHSLAYAMCLFTYDSRCHIPKQVIKPLDKIHQLRKNLNEQSQQKNKTLNETEYFGTEPMEVPSYESYLEHPESSDLVSNYTATVDPSATNTLNHNFFVVALMLLIIRTIY